MSDLNWCTYCDNAITITSNNLYCSEDCLELDALQYYHVLGNELPDFKHFSKNNLYKQCDNNSPFIYKSTANQSLSSSVLLKLFISSSLDKIDRTSNLTNNSSKIPSFLKK